MTRMLILMPVAGLCPCSQSILELEGYALIEAADSYERFQAT